MTRWFMVCRQYGSYPRTTHQVTTRAKFLARTGSPAYPGQLSDPSLVCPVLSICCLNPRTADRVNPTIDGARSTRQDPSESTRQVPRHRSHNCRPQSRKAIILVLRRRSSKILRSTATYAYIRCRKFSVLRANHPNEPPVARCMYRPRSSN